MPDSFYEKFFIAKPTTTSDPHTYINAEGRQLKWSATFPLPEIGARIHITMNRIGPAIVKGYFEAGDPAKAVWLGVMTKATKPPAYLKRQQAEAKKDPTLPEWMRSGIGAEFGSEILPTRPKAKKVTA